ncbi:aminopeptidase [Lachnospiraceae bacterium CLA-AA-H215]|uniref:M18 family aminopeptidase n=1 Tax=Hominifimenecus microfluidus TaxID=2885348 RepID=A0AAE3EB83_9FIRM|nr:aminopeptidase [Hominifimenecus microfluidus]MCC2231484.1 aminopeptidase [Hominifimenecus microfluidus]
MERKNAWLSYSEEERAKLNQVCDDYKAYLSIGKTERECVTEAVRLAEAKGYRRMEDVMKAGETLKEGDRVYRICMNKTLVLFQIGSEPIENGMNILGAHIDSPRLDLKQNPLYEDTDMVLLDTHYYGGVKKYQWVAMPLALHGVVAKKDGTSINVVIGEDPEDPVLCISDLLPHLAADQMQKKASEIIDGEALDVLFGSEPAADADEKEKELVKKNILALLKAKYDMEEEDFISAELEIVPAGAARDCGLDRSMVIGYGQDDRICAYTSLAAQLDMGPVKRTAVCLLVDKEEIGSVGATGMHSRFFENTVAELMSLAGQYTDLGVRRAIANSRMLSSDVSAAFDPNFAGVFEKKNSAYFGRGLVFNKYTGSRGKSGSNDASAEYMAAVRRVMDDNGVFWQTAEIGKVDQGGGGTIAYIMANYGMEVIDSGIAVLSMHAPWEIGSKADIYEGYKGYMAFLKDA